MQASTRLPNQVPLYSLQRILSVDSPSIDSHGASYSSYSGDEPRRSTLGNMFASLTSTMISSSPYNPDYPAFPTQIICAAQGGYIGNEFFALYTSNNYLIFRHVGESGVPLVRTMPWFKEVNMRIVGMAFNHSAQWLMCITADLSVVVVSIYFMMIKNSLEQPLKIIQTMKYGRDKRPHFSDCKCWRSSAGVEYGIITTTPGNVRFVNLSNGEFVKLKAKSGLGKVDIISESMDISNDNDSFDENPPINASSLISSIDSIKTNTFLILESPGYGFYRLLIESYLDNGKYEDICSPGAIMKPQFQINFISNIPKNYKLHVQETNRGNVIVMFDPDTSSISIYDEYFRPMFKYQINVSPLMEVKIVHLTEKLIFVLASPKMTEATQSEQSTVMIFSKLLCEDNKTQSIPYQEFVLPDGQEFKGNFACFAERFSKANKEDSSPKPSLISESNSRPTSAKLRKPLSSKMRLQITPSSPSSPTSSSSAPSSPGSSNLFSFTKSNPQKLYGHNTNALSDESSIASNTTNPPSTSSNSSRLYFDDTVEQDYDDDYIVDVSALEGMFFYSTDTVYELKSVAAPEQLFFEFIEKIEQKQGESLGLTFALDVCRLYELAADQYFEQGNIGQAQHLYYLSNVATTKLIRQYLSVGRMDVAISKLRVMLMQGKLGEARRPRVANELIKCHLQRLLSPATSLNLKRLLSPTERSRDEDLESFLKNNPDYQDKEVMNLFNKYGLIRFGLIAAQSRGKLKKTIEEIGSMRGLSYLSNDNIRFLSENNAIEGPFKVELANTLLSHLPPKVQLRHHLSSISNIQNNIPRIFDLLSELDSDGLIQVCRFFDPQGGFVNPMIEKSFVPSSDDASSDLDHESMGNKKDRFPRISVMQSQKAGGMYDTRLLLTQCVELFLTALLMLNKGLSHLPQSWNSPPSSPKHISSADLPSNLSESSNSNKSLEVASALQQPTNSLVRQKNDLTSSLPLQRGIKHRKAISVSCGFHHTAILTDEGQVFTWGAGSKGQLGHENVSETLWIPKLVSGLLPSAIGGEKISQVTCGANHTIVLTNHGNLYSFGSNAKGQLGLGDVLDRTEPKLVPISEDLREYAGNIVDIAAGFWHSVIVAERAVLYSGVAIDFQTDLLTFNPIPKLPQESFIKARCGFGHSVLLAKSGSVYSFGSNDYGQLGLGHLDSVLIPQRVTGILEDKHIIDISCGSFATFALSDVYSVYAWGQGTKWRLGLLNPSTRPSQGVHQKSLSGSFNYSQTNVILNQSPLRTSLQSNRSASPDPRSSLPSQTNSNTDSASEDDLSDFVETSPVRIDSLQGKECHRVFAGPSHAFALNVSGSKIYIWGEFNTALKTKNNEKDDPRLPRQIPSWSSSPITQLSCGDGFSVAINQEGQIFTFGSGIYGQLGHNDQLDCSVPRQAFLNGSVLEEEVENLNTSSSSDHQQSDKANSVEFNTSNLPGHSSEIRHSTSAEPHSLADSISTYDSALLESTLHSLHGRYRPATILQQCLRFDNLVAASIILELSGCWAASLDCKIRLLQREFPRIASLNHQIHLLTELLKDLAQPNVLQQAREEGLEQVLTMWKQIGAPASSLESLLTGSSLLPALASLLEKSENQGLLGSVGLEFSSKFYLQVVKQGLEQQRRAMASTKSNPSRNGMSMVPTLPISSSDSAPEIVPLSLDSSWIERRNNLEKDMKQKTKIQISQPALEDHVQHNRSTNNASKATSKFTVGAASDVVFSCGHLISESKFSSSTLPLFREKMSKLPVSVPLSTKLLISDYNLKSFNSACPACVYNHLREKYAPSQEKWTLTQ